MLKWVVGINNWGEKNECSECFFLLTVFVVSDIPWQPPLIPDGLMTVPGKSVMGTKMFATHDITAEAKGCFLRLPAADDSCWLFREGGGEVKKSRKNDSVCKY